MIRPGGYGITDQAMEIWQLPKGASVLDIGCGRGETVKYLTSEYGFQASGIDISKEIIRMGLAENGKLEIKYGDGEFLEDFSSFTFDGVMMECTLSLINIPEEALHEAYCVLKKGGKLFVSDLYMKDPDDELVRELQAEAELQQCIPLQEGECIEKQVSHISEFRADGMFLLTPLLKCLKEIGYVNIAWQDCTLELDNYLAEKLMNGDSVGGCLSGKQLNPQRKSKAGYFMLTAEKPY